MENISAKVGGVRTSLSCSRKDWNNRKGILIIYYILSLWFWPIILTSWPPKLETYCFFYLSIGGQKTICLQLKECIASPWQINKWHLSVFLTFPPHWYIADVYCHRGVSEIQRIKNLFWKHFRLRWQLRWSQGDWWNETIKVQTQLSQEMMRLVL